MRYNRILGVCILLTTALSSFAVPQQPEGLDGPFTIDLLKYFISQNPDNGETWARLAEAYLDLKQNEEAVQALKEAVRVQPGNASLRVDLANLLDDIGDADEAILQYLAAIRLQPDNPDIHRNLGIAHYRKHDLSSAETAFREALRLDPHYELARASLLQLLIETAAPDAALAELRTGIRLDRRSFIATLVPEFLPMEQDEIQRAGEEAVAHFCLGLLLVRVKDTDNAIKQIEHALLLDSNFGLGHQVLAVMYAKKERFAEGLSAFQSALRFNPNLPGAHLGLGELYKQLGRGDDALTAIQAAIRAAPDRPEAYTALGFLYWELARTEDALSSLRHALALTEPESQQAGQAHVGLSLVYGRLSQFVPAWKHFREAQQLGASIPPEHADFLMTVYPETKLAELEAETARLKTILEDNPNDAETHLKLAYALHRQGELENAVAEYQAVLRIARPGQASLVNAYVDLSAAYEQMGRVKDAQDTMEEALRVDPTNALLLNNAAWSYATTGDLSLRNPRKALEYARKAVERSGQKEATYLDTLAESYFVNGQFDQAIKTIKRAVAMEPDGALNSAYYKRQQKKFEEAKRTTRRR